MVRGTVPADICFIGEAPGSSEDSIGLPFIGPAGQLLDSVVTAALEEHPQVSYCYINLVGCFPKKEKKTADHRPPHDAVQECRPRTEGLLRLIYPKLLICVGAMAEEYTRPGYRHSIKTPSGTKVESITHPAAIMRMPIVRQPLEIKRCIILIRDAVEEMLQCQR